MVHEIARYYVIIFRSIARGIFEAGMNDDDNLVNAELGYWAAYPRGMLDTMTTGNPSQSGRRLLLHASHERR